MNPGCHVCFTRLGIHPHEIEHLETTGDFTRVWYEKVWYCRQHDMELRVAAHYDRMGIVE